jgi:hypothetical protein
LNQNEAIEIKRTLESVYQKYKETTDSLFIILMGEYEFETMQVAVIKLIKTSKYPPSIAELLQEYKSTTVERRSIIIDEMNALGYFKSKEEYEKSIVFVTSNVIPPFLRKMIQEHLRNKNQKALGEAK